MSIGLLNLVNIGKENIYLSTNPEITYFKTTYKRYTNFSIEQMPQYFNTTPDFYRKCNIIIGKNADLINKIYLYVELPEINVINKKFKWSDKIGLIIIKNVEVNIGGITIDRHCMDWLNIWNELTITASQKKGYDKIIGNTKELTNYSNNIKKNILYIPLIFWFCKNISLSLPIIALKKNDIKIYIEFNDINNCYNISPSNYITITNNYCLFNENELIYQYSNNNKIIARFNYFDFKKKKFFYTRIKDDFVIPIDETIESLKITNENNSFSVYIQTNSVVIKENILNNYNKPSILNAYLLVDYIYLDTTERSRFINSDLEYIIDYVQTSTEKILNTIYTTYNLPFYNLVKLLCWRAITKYNRNNNNHFVYNNVHSEDSNIIYNNLLVLNSVNATEIGYNLFYTILQKYKYNYKNINSDIYSYSFSTKPIDDEITGSINFSMLDESYLKLTLDTSINYQNPIYIQAYALTYNIINISNGSLKLLYDV